MEIRDGLLRTTPESSGELDIASEESPNHGGEFRAGRPDTIVIHYIGSLKLARQLFLDSTKKLSAHLVVDRAKRRVVQMVNFSTIAWHAGRSSHEGRDGLNPYSIGIEVG